MRRALLVISALTLLLAGLSALPATSASARAASIVPKAVNGPSVTKYLRGAINQLPVRGEVRTGYERSKFKLWDDVDKDCQDARSEVLRQETRSKVTGPCTVRSGTWVSQYDGAVRKQASRIDIDHMVPLAEAWDSGARAWNAQKREAYANDLADPRTLIAVTAESNRSKSDRDPAEWMPDQKPCKYVAQWVAVKLRWRLSVDTGEKSALQAIASSCPNWRFSTHYARVTLIGNKAPAPQGNGGNAGGGGGGGGCTPGYSPCLPPASDYDCASGSGNGPAYVYEPVLVTGSDPYDLDSNGDGWGCE